jgi:hypothetical protein
MEICAIEDELQNSVSWGMNNTKNFYVNQGDCSEKNIYIAIFYCAGFVFEYSGYYEYRR